MNTDKALNSHKSFIRNPFIYSIALHFDKSREGEARHYNTTVNKIDFPWGKSVLQSVFSYSASTRFPPPSSQWLRCWHRWSWAAFWSHAYISVYHHDNNANDRREHCECHCKACRIAAFISVNPCDECPDQQWHHNAEQKIWCGNHRRMLQSHKFTKKEIADFSGLSQPFLLTAFSQS